MPNDFWSEVADDRLAPCSTCGQREELPRLRLIVPPVTNWPQLPHIPAHDVADAVRRSGSHYFDADTMRFFESRTDGTAVSNGLAAFLVVSNRGPIHDGRRYYFVVRVDMRGHLVADRDHVTFTLAAARKHAARLARAELAAGTADRARLDRLGYDLTALRGES